MTGSKVERVLQLAGMTADKNSIPGDTSAIIPGRVRLGMPALTARGLDARDFDAVAEFLHRGCDLDGREERKGKGGIDRQWRHRRSREDSYKSSRPC